MIHIHFDRDPSHLTNADKLVADLQRVRRELLERVLPEALMMQLRGPAHAGWEEASTALEEYLQGQHERARQGHLLLLQR